MPNVNVTHCNENVSHCHESVPNVNVSHGNDIVSNENVCHGNENVPNVNVQNVNVTHCNENVSHCIDMVSNENGSRVTGKDKCENASQVISIFNVNATSVTQDWLQCIDIEGNHVYFKLDSGSQVDIIPLSVFERFPPHLQNKTECDVVLKTYSNHKMKPVGECHIQVQVDQDKTVDVTLQIVNANVIPILGKTTCEHMGLLQKTTKALKVVSQSVKQCMAVNPVPDNIATNMSVHMSISNSNHNVKNNCEHKPSDRAIKLLKDNEDLFQGLGCLQNRVYDIDIDPTVKPVQSPPRQIPHKIRDQVKAELDRMVSIDVIEPVTEPTEWISAITTVIKKNGDVRVCLDPRDLNTAIRRQHYPMTTIESVIANIPNASIFSKFDAKSGYWQLRLSDESKKLTTFNTPWGRYMFKRMPFGIKSAAEVWQRAMMEEYGELEGLHIIVDDMMLIAEDDAKHDDRLEQFLNRVRQSGLKLNKPKCEVSVNHTEFAGHLVTAEGVKPSPERIRALVEMPKPQDKKELQTFLGIM